MRFLPRLSRSTRHLGVATLLSSLATLPAAVSAQEAPPAANAAVTAQTAADPRLAKLKDEAKVSIDDTVLAAVEVPGAAPAASGIGAAPVAPAPAAPAPAPSAKAQ